MDVAIELYCFYEAVVAIYWVKYVNAEFGSRMWVQEVHVRYGCLVAAGC